MSSESRGAEWRKWDLHVHTPASVVQHFGPDNEETWARYIDELEALPSDIRVLGINDYWFLDGYGRVRAAKAAGRLANIDEIFPVVELRLEQFGGTSGAWKRVNMHVVFDPDLGEEVIQQQFLSAMSHSFHLDPSSPLATWSGVVTRESLSELGRALKANAPEEQRDAYGSDLEEGFNNLVVTMADVSRVLDSSFLRGRTLLGIGRAEWESIRWQDGSIASKKSIINLADFVFTASRDVSTWPGIVKKLRDANVTHQLLDCSDAHYWTGDSQNERLGRCDTWINASPSFAGLMHALSEFDSRIHVGLEPPVRSRIRRHPHHFIDSVAVSSSDPSTHPLFGYQVNLNPGFVSVIGNKGQGKSAFLDCIALAGNSARSQEFAFLNGQRFLNSSNRAARHYGVELSWMDSGRRAANFLDKHDPQTPVQVEYLPQAFVERLCTAVPKSAADDDFEAELRAILFTHIRDDDRAGADSFEELLRRKVRGSEDRIEVLRRDLGRLIDSYLSLARFRAEHSVAEVEGRRASRLEELAAAVEDREMAEENLKELEIASADDGVLESLIATAAELQSSRDAAKTRVDQLREQAGLYNQQLLALESINERVKILASDAASLNEEVMRMFEAMPVPGQEAEGPVIEFSFDRHQIDSWKSHVERMLGQNAAEALVAEQRRNGAETELTTVTAQLAARDSARELARQTVIQSKERENSLLGDVSAPESLRGLEALKERVEAIPQKIDSAAHALIEQAREIHDAFLAQLGVVADLYEPAASSIRDSPAISLAGLEFRAELRIVPALGGLGSQLDARKSPGLGDRITSVPDGFEASEWPELSEEIAEVLDALGRDRGQADGSFRDPESALRSGSTAGDFLRSLLGLQWMEVRFGLTGDGLPLSRLSPGQRGLILALLYLVVDRRETPLLLDQPEENLDNETISSLLVPAIREAAGRRQTIVVTHNANLAIVGDADQIVHCVQEDGRFLIDSGSISDFATAKHAVDVLEGTMPSFVKRESKWAVHPTLRAAHVQ